MTVRVVARAQALLASRPEAVFDFVTRPGAVAETFRGWGPIPGARRSHLPEGGALRVGAVRRVDNSDGSIVDEEIVALERPSRQAYRLVRGLRPPMTWLAREARGDWSITPEGTGSLVRWSFTIELRSPLWWPLGRLVAFAFTRAMNRALAETRRRLEAGRFARNH